MYIGIDIGGTNIKGVLTNQDGDILYFKKIQTQKTAADIENAICGIVEQSAEKIGKKNKIKAIGIGAAGAIDKQKGMILTSANIPSWKKYPIVKAIENRTGVKAYLENDATSAVLGEWWKGSGRNFRNWIMLTLGTGIGGGAIIDNKIYTGRSGSSMEVGHTTIDYKGRKCACGNRGCLELYASATAIVRSAKVKLKKYPASSINDRVKNEKLSAKLLYEEAVKGDSLAKLLFDETGTFLGIGISNLVSIFNPEAIILAGGLSEAHKLILPVVKKIIHERVQEGLKENIKYLLVKDQERIPALGAAKAAIEAYKTVK